MRHFTQVADFNKKDYEEVFRRAAKFQKGGDFTHLAAGKVLGSLFFSESTRTSTGHKAAIISLGGGWVGVDGIKGTYLETAEEDLEDFILSYQDSVDLMVIRHSTFDLINFAPKLHVPVINGMCGKDEHASAVVGMIYTLMKHRGNLKNLKVGVYGMVSVSRPMKALYKLLAMFGATIIEDPLVETFACPPDLRAFVEKHGGKIIPGKYKEFMKEVDLFVLVEALPQKGADEKEVEKFNKKFTTMALKDFDSLPAKSGYFVVMPRKTTDGRLTAEKDVDNDPRNITFRMFRDWRYVMMAVMTILLDIKV